MENGNDGFDDFAKFFNPRGLTISEADRIREFLSNLHKCNGSLWKPNWSKLVESVNWDATAMLKDPRYAVFSSLDVAENGDRYFLSGRLGEGRRFIIDPWGVSVGTEEPRPYFGLEGSLDEDRRRAYGLN